MVWLAVWERECECGLSRWVIGARSRVRGGRVDSRGESWGLFSRSLDRRCGRSLLWWSRLAGLAVRWEGLEAFEGVEDRTGPGPVGWEVKGVAAGVVGELPGDVQDPVAQPFGFADPVL